MKTIPGLFFFLLRLAKDRRARSHRLLARLLRDEEGGRLAYIYDDHVAGADRCRGPWYGRGDAILPAPESPERRRCRGLQRGASMLLQHQSEHLRGCGYHDVVASYPVASFPYVLGTGTNQANVSAITDTTTYSPLTAVRVTILRPQTAIFSSILFSVLPNSVSATAVINGGNPSGGCVLALGKDPTSGTNNLANAISLQGNPTISIANCGIFSDSTDCVGGAYSESIGGSAVINAGSLGSAGCTRIFGNAQVNLPNSVTCNSSNDSACTQNDGTESDPYAGTWTSVPSNPSACTQTNYSPSLHSTTIALPAGRYCGTTQFHGTGGTPSTITLSAGGVYIFDSQGASGTTLDLKKVTLTDQGAGATLVFTCSTCSSSSWPSQMMATDSNSTMCVTAPAGPTTTNPTAGFVVIGDPAMPLNTTFTTWANGHLTERSGCRQVGLAGAGMQRPPRAPVITRLAVSATFVFSLSPTKLPWVAPQGSVAWAVAFQAVQAGILKSRSPPKSRLWTRQRCRSKNLFRRERRYGWLSGPSCLERREPRARSWLKQL